MAPCGSHFLFLLLVHRVGLGNRIEFLRFVFLTRVFLHFIIEACVIHMTLANALSVADRNEFYE